MGRMKCAVPGCTDQNSSRHRFPNPTKYLDILEKWKIILSSNPDIKTLTNHQIRQKLRVCSLHFDKNCFSPGMRRPNYDACPSLYISGNKKNKKTVNIPSCSISQFQLEINETKKNENMPSCSSHLVKLEINKVKKNKKNMPSYSSPQLKLAKENENIPSCSSHLLKLEINKANKNKNMPSFTSSQLELENMAFDEGDRIKELIADDIRWPTSLEHHGSDAMHTDPDYSCVYVTITLENGMYGNGITFTLGRGTEVVQKACEALKHLVINKNIQEIFDNFAYFWRTLTSESQIRWIGPEKGVTHLAVAAIINALWDLWGKIENKPVWKLLVDMTPEKLVSTIDFRYISDVIKPEECIKMLNDQISKKNIRLNDLKNNGYPAYTTQVGWLGYSDKKIIQLCKEYLRKGFTAFKIKVGQNLQNDIKRCNLVREAIGWDNILMIDANQIWDVEEAISWVKSLAVYKPLWIEEPTSPDDILGHKRISDALKEYNIGVATGEMCANRVIFKQFLQLGALQFCQIDSARIGGINEILSVYFMAKKFNIKVCPHAGGIGLCEMVQHLQMWDYVSLSGTKDDRYIEYIDQQHDQFIAPAIVNEKANYVAPTTAGYSTELKCEAIEMFKYPNGLEWKNLQAS